MKNKEDTIKPTKFYDYFTHSLEFRSLNEVKDHLDHFPFSYDEPPEDDKPWNVININSYKDVTTLKKIIDDCVKCGSFKILDPPKIFASVIESLSAKNELNSKTNPKLSITHIPLVYFIKMYGEMDVLIAIKQMKNNNLVKIIISMNDQNLYLYYKYIFILAHLFNIKF